MRKLVISRDLANLVFLDGVERYPNEACGIILGEVRGEDFLSREIVRSTNLSEDPMRYVLDPKDFIRAQEYADERGLEIIGVYHTHPDHPPIASQHDFQAAVEGLVYLIASVWEGRENGGMRAYILSERGTFLEIEVDVRD